SIYTILPNILGHPYKISRFRYSNYLHGHRCIKTASTNIFEGMGCSQELSEFKGGTVIGCHLCKSIICEISLLLNIARSNVSGIIIKVEAIGNNRNSATKW
ncbi:unnamed protein product, partial [Staurois parvus]